MTYISGRHYGFTSDEMLKRKTHQNQINNAHRAVENAKLDAAVERIRICGEQEGGHVPGETNSYTPGVCVGCGGQIVSTTDLGTGELVTHVIPNISDL